jgi:hypothetical protein
MLNAVLKDCSDRAIPCMEQCSNGVELWVADSCVAIVSTSVGVFNVINDRNEAGYKNSIGG